MNPFTRSLAAAGAVALVAVPLAAQPPATIPLRAGLTTVGAVVMTTGDAEMITRVDQVTADGVRIVYSGQFLTSRGDDPLSTLLGGNSKSTAKPELGRIKGVRLIRRADLESARHWQSQFASNQPQVFPGTTSFNVSTLVFNELKTKGQAEFSCSCAPGAPGAIGSLGSLFGEALGKSSDGKPLAAFAKLSGTLRRVEPKPVPFSVIVNDVRVTVPTIHAKGRLGSEESDFYILDDPQNRMILSGQVGPQTSRVVKIAFPTEAPRIATELAKAGRVDVYGIYFDFGSAVLRPESEPVLTEIAEALTKNTAWKLKIDGHTDNVGGDPANLDLSRRRAASVRDALVSRYKIPATRLSTDGFGASRPKESNTTPDGRARNRRVELVRQ